MATKANIVIDQSTTVNITVVVNNANGKPLDLTNYVGAAQLKKHWTSLNASASFTVNANSNVGIVTLTMNANISGNLASGRYVYDVLVADPSNNYIRVVEGFATVTPAVTNQVFQNATTIFAESNINPTILSNGSIDNANNAQQ